MLKEIPFQAGKIVFFKESGFWNELLEKCKKETNEIFIATYNFNFKDKYEKTFYKELAKLADLGVDIRLLYAKTTYSDQDALELEEVFKNFVLCAELPTNHSKIFITDNFAYIGSANFSFGSNNNYESGVIFNNPSIISKIREYYCMELVGMSELKNIPQLLNPFSLISNIQDAIKILSNVDNLTDLYIAGFREVIPELQYLQDINEIIGNLGYDLLEEYDWLSLYLQLYDEDIISNTVFFEFKYYLDDLLTSLDELSSYLKKQYETIGKLELLKRANAL